MEALAGSIFTVPRRPQENISMPVELVSEVEALVQRFGRKRKWMIYAAAILGLLELTPEEMERAVEAVGAADTTGRFAALVMKSRVKGGTGRKAEELPGGTLSTGEGAAVLKEGDPAAKVRRGSNRKSKQTAGSTKGG